MSKHETTMRGVRTVAAHARRGGGIIALLAAATLVACDVPTALPRFDSTFAVPGPEVQVPVVGAPVPAVPVTLDLGEVDEDLRARAQGGEIQLTPLNPEDGTGTLQVTITDAESAATVSQTIEVTAAGTPQIVNVGADEMRAFLGGDVTITVTGTLGPAAIPTRLVVLETLVRITFELGGED
jgi:hypothetical protein